MRIVQVKEFGGPEVLDATRPRDRDITVRGIDAVQTFPLERASDGHRAIEAQAVIGKTLLVI